MQKGLRTECKAPKIFTLQNAYFFVVSFAAGAATHVPLPSFPPLASHVIFAFSQSALLVGVGVVCANATAESANEAITATMGSNFIWFSCGCSFCSTSHAPHHHSWSECSPTEAFTEHSAPQPAAQHECQLTDAFSVSSMDKV